MKYYPTLMLPQLALVLAFALPAHAETAQQDLEYQSAFEDYQPYNEPEIQNWPEVNQTVGEIGGWRVYAREPYEKKPAEEPHQHGGEKP